MAGACFCCESDEFEWSVNVVVEALVVGGVF